ncbi:MAG: hypothetical protein R3300_10810 [Candidatus Promineifilaceae bacterium]|nr:hypothetical protein [Candidatus Promineifilaceae bacterium]
MDKDGWEEALILGPLALLLALVAGISLTTVATLSGGDEITSLEVGIGAVTGLACGLPLAGVVGLWLATADAEQRRARVLLAAAIGGALGPLILILYLLIAQPTFYLY